MYKNYHERKSALKCFLHVDKEYQCPLSMVLLTKKNVNLLYTAEAAFDPIITEKSKLLINGFDKLQIIICGYRLKVT